MRQPHERGSSMLRPGYLWRCFCCHYQQETAVPQHAWLNDDEPTYVCFDCRNRPYASLSPDRMKCRDCGNVIILDEDESDHLRDDAEAVISLIGSTAWYVFVCDECMTARHLAAAERAESRRWPRSLPLESLRIREMAVHFQGERGPKGKRLYSVQDAYARAVEIEMDVDDCARHPEFMRWLRRR